VIDLEIIKYAHERVAIEAGEQRRQLRLDIEKTKAELARRGIGRGGTMITAIQNVYAQAVIARVEIVWGIMLRGVTTVGIKYSEDVEGQLKEFVGSYFPENMEEFQSPFTTFVQQSGMGDVLGRFPDEIENARSAALAKIYSEIRLFTMNLKNAPEAGTYSPQFTFNNSNIGAVQTGNQSIANVNLQSNSADFAALQKALDVVAQELAKIGDLPNHNKTDIIDMVEDGKAELAKEKPNLTKLSACLPTISGAIGVLARGCSGFCVNGISFNSTSSVLQTGL
jgi:predicted RNA-binding protein YlqC (UPF0109 family)